MGVVAPGKKILKGTTNKVSVLEEKQAGGSVSHLTDSLRVGYHPPPPPSTALAILNGAIVSFYVFIDDHQLKDLLHITHISSQWLLTHFYTKVWMKNEKFS